MNLPRAEIQKAIEQLRNGIKYKKCWRCGCQQQTVRAIEKALPSLSAEDQAEIGPLLKAAKSTFTTVEYDCLGCNVCFPAIAANEMTKAYPSLSIQESCGAEEADLGKRTGWPPLPGDYEVGRYRAPVAICTLNTRALVREISSARHPGVAIVGSLSTENLGIERLINNVVTDPHIRFLILCGDDSKQKIGHLPGQSLASLLESGTDAAGRIIGAKGKRPLLKNIDARHVARFRQQVALVSLVGTSDIAKILAAASACGERDPGALNVERLDVTTVPTIEAQAGTLTLDPNGYFVLFLDRARRVIVVEHYANTGVLQNVIEGRASGDIYSTAIRLGLISRLDHACYLGQELARAQAALEAGADYRQDRAPGESQPKESPACTDKKCCGEDK